MVITIDGPAGAGKSTVARSLAKRLAFEFLDTGAMYRSVALAALRQQADWKDADRLVQIAEQLTIELPGDRVVLNGADVTDQIRHSEVTQVIHFVADHPRIRHRMVELQRQAAAERDLVTEGRDQGTVVFPDAACKVFLTASPEERARRRQREQADRGEQWTLDELLQQQNERDRRDANRPVGKLTAARDAVTVFTDGKSIEQVVDRIEQIVRQRIAAQD